jgi:hypothetical protein
LAGFNYVVISVVSSWLLELRLKETTLCHVVAIDTTFHSETPSVGIAYGERDKRVMCFDDVVVLVVVLGDT